MRRDKSRIKGEIVCEENYNECWHESSIHRPSNDFV